MTTLETESMMAAPTTPEDMPISSTTRRSTRSKRVPLKYDEEYIIPSETPSAAKLSARPDRPKRRAAEAARSRFVPEQIASLQEQVFARMDIDERKEYGGWVELESEPAFFNAMLQDLDAKTLKIQEIFALDEDSLAELPKPVYGLIFLYEWTNEDESNEARQGCPENLWFGNQTTANACATVALMNIIMNINSVKFGPELEEFRDATKPLAPPHRGHALDTNDFIRAIHNSVARRNDLLSEDLLLENKYETACKKAKVPAKKRKKTSKSSKRNYEPGTYHYIAFVPVDGQVWELDGLESMPLSLGPYTPGTDAWLGVASEAIQRRMSRQTDEFLSFNLLAICQSPLQTLSHNLATTLATAHTLDNAITHASPSWTIPSPWADFFDDRLAPFNLTRAQILASCNPDINRVKAASADADAAGCLARELRTELEALEAQYVAETATVGEAVEMIRARQRDYTPAVHQWVRILAEKGAFRELIREADSLG
ncbi:cysteine proteinase [Hypoxylon argillaceum]|nr:cysteine proteinase [Hypoxylon argillaceum]